MKKLSSALLLTGLIALFSTSCKKDNPGSGSQAESCDASFTTSAAAFYVQFTPTVVGDAQLSSHLWNFGGDETSTEAAPLHAFPAAGNYNVKHIFRKLDAAGNILCTDTSIMSQSVINDSIFVQISTPTVEFNTFDFDGFY
jgi:PKD repeat protein